MKHWFPIARWFVSFTLLVGAYLHLSNLVFGTDLLLARLFTPTFDSLFALPMAVGGFAVIAARREYAFRNRFEKVVVFWTGFYFIGSLPLHVQTWFTHSTEYIRLVPLWFSALFLVYTTVMQLTWWNLRAKPSAEPLAAASA